MRIKAQKSGSKLWSNGSSSTRNSKMKRLKKGDKIIDPDRLFPEYGTILEHVDSDVSEDVYLIRWMGGCRTLFEVKRENLVN
tara:strand:- start:940 stop:1185 length:246 start_codon:yes stop_codon:yes gene_type:complete